MTMRYLLCLLMLLVAGAASAQVCAVQTTSNGWTWNCPQLPAAIGSVCKTVSEDGVDMSSGHNWAGGAAKYGSNAAWATAFGTAKMPNEGINTAGQYSYTYMSNYPTNGVPYEPTEDMGLYLQQDRFSYHLKNQAWLANPTGMACTGSAWYNGETPDDFDPAAQADYNDLWAQNGTGGNPSINSFPRDRLGTMCQTTATACSSTTRCPPILILPIWKQPNRRSS
jgi:hypothetical protein